MGQANMIPLACNSLVSFIQSDLNREIAAFVY